MADVPARDPADGKEPASVRPPADRNPRSSELRRALGRLEGLPLRPMTALAALDAFPEAGDEPEDAPTPLALPKFLDSDPGWVLADVRADHAPAVWTLLSERAWWRTSDGEAA